MSRRVEIRGGAGEFEAAVIAVVLDRIVQEESAARQRRGNRQPGLSPWVRAVRDANDARPVSWAPRQDFPHLG